MRQYCIYAKPDLPQLNGIQELRLNFDPLAEKIPPHVTLVFPFHTNIEADLLNTHIAQHLNQLDAVPIRMQSPEARDSYAYFPIEDTTSQLAEIFERLNGGILSEFRSNEHSFQPHITFGRYKSEKEKTDMLSAAESLRLNSGQIIYIFLEEVLETQMGQILYEWKLNPLC